jgi:hypothetical protein
MDIAAHASVDALQVFARAVLRAAKRVPAKGRFGEKVFISAVRDNMNATLKGTRLEWSDADFADYLVAAHRAGALVLARADLTSSMDPKVVASSEVQYLNAAFHFVRVAS